MKKELLTILLVFMCFATSISFVACAPKAPRIDAWFNVVYWDNVEDAEYYNIYQDDKVIESTRKNSYIFDNLKDDATVAITAVNESGKESPKSNTILLYKITGFDEGESQTIELENNQTYRVDSRIRYLKITGESTGVDIEINTARKTDLIIELNNVEMKSTGQHCIHTVNNLYNLDDVKFALIFIINGTNTIQGSAGESVTAQPEVNSQQCGYKGPDGYSAIVAPTVVMTGEGSLSLVGGNGGTGGIGASSKGWFSTSVYGKGGDGGDGAPAIICKNLILALNSGNRLMLSGGKGGNGGRPGENGSVLTGPWLTLFGDWNGSYGNPGVDAIDYEGELTTISGGLL